jgi:hypothetical protein
MQRRFFDMVIRKTSYGWCNSPNQKTGCGRPPLGEIWNKHQVIMDENQNDDPDVNNFMYMISQLDLEEDLDSADDNFLLLAPRLLGYAPKEKAWAQFSLDTESIKPPVGKQPENFDRVLQLGEQFKTAIKALVRSYDLKQENPTADVVKGKGKGLVLLFHGPPGVGKTVSPAKII